MLDLLIVMNLVILQRNCKAERSRAKKTGTSLTLENMVSTEENKQILVAMSHKGFQGIGTFVKRANREC